jgi:hypothetical protein
MRKQRHAPLSHTVAALFACAWMALSGAIHFASAAHASGDAEEIRALIGATWDKPDSKVETDPIVVSGRHAVASWTQGVRGGRALLKRDDKGWAVVLCSGDPLTRTAWLVEAGVPEDNALQIAEKLTAAEAQIPTARRAQFSLFDGAVSAAEEPGEAMAPHEPHKH